MEVISPLSALVVILHTDRGRGGGGDVKTKKKLVPPPLLLLLLLLFLLHKGLRPFEVGDGKLK